ncbi:MAG: hypothetical protein WBA98_13685 [Gordonia sp. (in: high G+C Gram-positive bacteria)]|uniref:hypothetical protein n=1 Tax=Gordonia sp. (in: high G+C Gram-positive bacteria) TaxID=84139 RepID=UPI003C7669F2
MTDPTRIDPNSQPRSIDDLLDTADHIIDSPKATVDELFDSRFDKDLLHYANSKLAENRSLCGVAVEPEPEPSGEGSSGSRSRLCDLCERFAQAWKELDWTGQQTVDFIEGRQ